MVERESHFERYQAMTPQQHNAEMQRIFGLLPSLDVVVSTLIRKTGKGEAVFRSDFTQAVRKIFEGRRESSLRQESIVQLETLLPFSLVTNEFQFYIADAFKDNFVSGISKKTLDGDVFPFGKEWYAELFQWNSEGGGIFGEQAKAIEIKAYKSAVEQQLKIEREWEEEDDLDQSREQQIRKKIIEQWTNGCIRHYGDEP